MKLSDISIQVRQRSPWEAIDLGFTLVQNHWRSLYLPWFLLLILLFGTVWLLTPEKYLWLPGIILWWLKPLYDRVILHILSHSLFARSLTLAEVFSALPGLIRHTGLLSALTFRRFSFSRSYNLPIWQLEGLHGAARKGRQDLLHLQGHSHAVWLTIGCVHLEWIVVASLYALVILFDPTGLALEHLQNIFSGNLSPETQYWQTMLDSSFYLCTMFILEPFYVAAGFMLYLNRRTQLEAWDIEIAFRSIGERLQNAVAATRQILPLLAVALLAALLWAAPATVQAASEEYMAEQRQPVGQAAQAMTEVMAAEELSDRRKITTWMPRDKNKKDKEKQDTLPEAIIQLIASGMKSLLWLAVLVGIILLIVYRQRILALLTPARKHKSTLQQPDVLFGLDIRPESLPDDIAATARQLWQQGKAREALSLLYRGALMLLTREEDIRIHDSHTEGDILRLAKTHLTEGRFAYLQAITRHWQAIAYAHRLPDSTAVIPLLEGWTGFHQSGTAVAGGNATGGNQP